MEAATSTDASHRLLMLEGQSVRGFSPRAVRGVRFPSQTRTPRRPGDVAPRKMQSGIQTPPLNVYVTCNLLEQ